MVYLVVREVWDLYHFNLEESRVLRAFKDIKHAQLFVLEKGNEKNPHFIEEYKIVNMVVD